MLLLVVMAALAVSLIFIAYEWKICNLKISNVNQRFNKEKNEEKDKKKRIKIVNSKNDLFVSVLLVEKLSGSKLEWK